MKKALLFLFIHGLIYAQNTADLFNNSWYISQITMGGTTTTSPTMDTPPGVSKFDLISGNYIFNSRYFNTAVNNITFSTTNNSFTKNSAACTLADYWGSNLQAVQEYDQKHCDMFVNQPVGHVFNYEIIPNGSGKTLIITDNSNGNKVYYNSFYLSTKDNNITTDFRILQNPIKENLIVEKLENGLPVQIVNMLGQLIYEGKTADRKLKVTTEKFEKGQYILMIKGQKPMKFIKE